MLVFMALWDVLPNLSSHVQITATHGENFTRLHPREQLQFHHCPDWIAHVRLDGRNEPFGDCLGGFCFDGFGTSGLQTVHGRQTGEHVRCAVFILDRSAKNSADASHVFVDADSAMAVCNHDLTDIFECLRAEVPYPVSTTFFHKVAEDDFSA